MAKGPTSDLRAEAIAWRIRLRDGTTADWEAFGKWIGQRAQNAAVYDEVALSDQELDRPMAALPRPASKQFNDKAQTATPRTRRWLLAGAGTALAAGAAALFMAPSLIVSRNDFYEVATKAGERRVLKFGDHNQVTLNGSSRIRLDRNDARFASLEGGEGSFDIKHDAKAPFTLEVGNNRLVDIGTSFNVVRYSTGHVVAVSEGTILYNPDREAIRLSAGQSLRSDDRDRRIQLARIDPAEVGSWQRGVLAYRGASLDDIASDLSRNLGKPVLASPRLASRSFTGTIEISGDEGQLFERLGKLLGVESRRTSDGWRLDEPTTSTD